MADKVILRASEYGALPSQVKDIHSNLISLYDRILDSMEETVQEGGLISTMDFSPNISSFTKEVRNNLKKNLADVFDTSEQLIDEYITMIGNIDAV